MVMSSGAGPEDGLWVANVLIIFYMSIRGGSES